MREKRNVKTRTLENHKGVAPNFVLALQGCATRLGCPRFRFLVPVSWVGPLSSLLHSNAHQQHLSYVLKTSGHPPFRWWRRGENVGAPTFKVLL